MGVYAVGTDSANITIQSTPQNLTLSPGQERRFELTGDNLYDIYVKLDRIEGGKAFLTIKSISEEILASDKVNNAGAGDSNVTAGVAGDNENNKGFNTKNKIIGIIVALIIIITLVLLYLNRKK